MADLNELSQFEKDLKHLIETRNAYQPNYNPPENYKPTPRATDQTYMMIWEHGQPYSSHREHKFPSHPTYSPEEMERLGRMGMFMGAVEHGQPYKVVQTKMAIKEHGQPYWKTLLKQQRDIQKQEGFTFSTNMAISEHGQPYKSSRMPSTRMAILEHGQPFTVSTNMAIKEHGQPYKTDEEFSSEFQKYLRNLKGGDNPKPGYMYNSLPEDKEKKSFTCTTDMVREVHGQPYKANYMLL